MQVERMDATEARSKWRDVMDAVSAGNRQVVVERHGKPIMALISFEDYMALQEEIEDLEDARESMEALAEAERDPTSLTDWEDVKRELGLDSEEQ